jgi:hypothetical protein
VPVGYRPRGGGAPDGFPHDEVIVHVERM